MKPLKLLACLLLIAFALVTSAYSKPTATKGVWRVVIVAATAEQGIQNGANAFVDYSRQEVTRLAGLLDLSLEITILKDKDLTPQQLEATLASLSIAPDTEGKRLLTWLSFSHGFNTPNSNSKLPYLIAHPTKTALAPQEMRYAFAIEEIYEELLKSKAYDHVHVWAELCNHICIGCQQVPTEGLVGLNAIDKSALERLLYGVEGEVMVSSSYGQASCSSMVGGPFSRALFEALSMVEMGEVPSAIAFDGDEGFFELVGELTNSYVQELPEIPCQKQSPQGYVGFVD